METTIKQSEEERNKALENAKQIYEDYRPLKDEVDMLRDSLGLERLPDVLGEEEKLSLE